MCLFSFLSMENENTKNNIERFAECVFRATMKGFGFAAVIPEEEDDNVKPEEIFIPASNKKDAFDGDKVLVKVNKTAFAGNKAEGEIVRILERGLTHFIGTFKKTKNSGFVIPDDKRIESDFFIQREHTKGAKDGQKVYCKITEYGGKKRRPEGRVVEILGDANDPKTDYKSVIREYNIFPEFSMEVVNEAEALPDFVTEPEKQERSDYRNLLTVTIDGKDAKDLDDAISIKRTDKGYKLYVHIADVSHYVTEGSALDESALKRGTSVYLINKVVPMLPKKLSNGICSLNAGQDRLALSCIMDIDENGKIFGHSIEETLINVNRRMNYDEVSEIVAAPDSYRTEYGELVDMFLLMTELSAKLRDNRSVRGALDFEFAECKVLLDDNDKPYDIVPEERNVASKIIEDFMLAANETVAESYYWQELPFLFRTHEVPDEEKITKLSLFAKNFGYTIKGQKDNIHPKEIQKLLNAIKGTKEEPVISRLALRSMRQARYTTECDGHFGLSAKYYCHFTSPIRRYPDLQIHRIIKENIHGNLDENRKNHYNEILESVAKETSRCERNAESCERDLVRFKHVEYMQERIGEAFEGVISGLSGRGIFVELPNTVEGVVPMSGLMDDYYVFDPDRYLIEGEKKHKTYVLGQKVYVLVLDTDKSDKTIEFSIIGEKKYKSLTEGD